MSETWRLIREPGLSTGAANMALDEALASFVAQGRVPPTLRIYGWSRRTISIGRFQAASDIDRAAAQAQAVEMVRRPTGGRALLHAEEVTYAVALPRDHPVARGGVLETYRRISQGLVAALAQLGLEADPLVPGRPGPGAHSAACFEIPSAYEITVGGKKLIGSAQCTRAGYVLQHGSVPLVGNQAALVPFLNLEQAARAALGRKLGRKSTSLAGQAVRVQGTRRGFTRAEVAAALAAGICHGLGVDLAESPIGPGEMETAGTLIRRKYANDAWTYQK